jgi:hypothetical protein
MDPEQVQRVAAGLGLHRGRMISWSKSAFVFHTHPTHEPVFNACLTDAAGAELWHGDVDLTVDEGTLLDLAAALGEPLFLLRESAIFNRRMGTPLEPARDAVLVLHPDRTTTQPEGSIERLWRDADGRIARPPRPPAEPAS